MYEPRTITRARRAVMRSRRTNFQSAPQQQAIANPATPRPRSDCSCGGNKGSRWRARAALQQHAKITPRRVGSSPACRIRTGSGCCRGRSEQPRIRDRIIAGDREEAFAYVISSRSRRGRCHQASSIVPGRFFFSEQAHRNHAGSGKTITRRFDNNGANSPVHSNPWVTTGPSSGSPCRRRTK